MQEFCIIKRLFRFNYEGYYFERRDPVKMFINIKYLHNSEKTQGAVHNLKQDYKEVPPFSPYIDAPSLVGQATDM